MASDSKQVAKEIYDNLVKMAKKDSATARRSAGDPANRKSYGQGSSSIEKRADAMYKKYTESLSSLYKSSKAVNEQLKDFNKKVKDSNGSIEATIKAQSKLMQRFIQNEHISNNAQERLVKNLKKITEDSSLFSASIHRNIESMRDFEEVIERSGDFMESYTRTIKDNNKQQLSQIKSNKAVKAALSELASTLYTGEELNTELNRIRSAESKQLKQIVKRYDDMSKEMNDFRSNINSATNRATMLGEAQGKLQDMTVNVGAAFGPLGEKVAKMVSGKMGLVAALGAVTAALFDAYGEMKSVAKSGFGGEYFGASEGDGGFLDTYISGPFAFAAKAGRDLAISTEAFTTMLNDNKNIVAKLGINGFKDTVAEQQKSLMALGATTEQAAAGIAGMMTNAQLAGIDVKNREALNKSIKDQVAAFHTLKATTGESVEEFNANNRSIASNSEFTQLFMRTSEDRRRDMIKNIALERARLSELGISAENQKKIIEETQKMLGDSVGTRFEKGAKAAQLAMMTGNADIANEIRTLMIRGERNSPEERARLSDLMMRLSKDTDSQMLGSLGMENVLGQQEFQSLIEPFRVAAREKETGKLSKDEVDRNKAMASIPDKMVEIIFNVERLKAIATNSSSTVTILGSILAAIVGGKLISRIPGIGKFMGSITGKISSLIPGKNAAKAVSGFVGSKLGAGKSALGGALKGGAKIAGTVGAMAAGTGVGSAVMGGLSKAGSAIATGAGKLPGAGLAKSLTSAAAGMGGKEILKGVGKIGLKAMKFLGPLGVLASGAIDAGMGVANAGEWFGTEKSSLGQKAAAGAGGLISGLTFGLVDGKNTAQGIYDFFGGGEPAKPKQEDSIVTKEKEEKNKQEAEQNISIFEEMKQQLKMSNEELKRMSESSQRVYEVLFDLLSNGRIKDMNLPPRFLMHPALQRSSFGY